MKATNSTERIFSKRLLWSLGISILIMTMSACGPIYKTEYILQPPETQQGQVCVMQCEQNRMQCKNNKKGDSKDCEHRNQIARLKLETCINSGAISCYDTTEPCPELNFNQCNKEHRYCYQSCGGKVIPQVTCAGYWGWECEDTPSQR
ncbi:MAG: hypothetical protein D3924_04915 [Candidatus Electrothrix sp. AR4]|nr:hypothetical protein [Candidatus Electrothrix sp. AR4]